GWTGSDLVDHPPERRGVSPLPLRAWGGAGGWGPGWAGGPGGAVPRGRAGGVAVALAVVGAVGVLATWLAGGAGIDVAWLPSWGARLALRLDGLGALYGLLATGIGVGGFSYASAYLPRP